MALCQMRPFLCFFFSPEEEESPFQVIGELGADGKALGSCFPLKNGSRTTFPTCPFGAPGGYGRRLAYRRTCCIAAFDEVGNSTWRSYLIMWNPTASPLQFLPLIKRATAILHVPWPTEAKQLDELRLVNKNLLRVSKLNVQAVGRKLVALLVARKKYRCWIPLLHQGIHLVPRWTRCCGRDGGRDGGLMWESMKEQVSPPSQATTSSAQSSDKLVP
ncbi:UNVERIFIED_CONTAM: hypothetical protein FKN15_035378 [Acipenser sinensis]